MFSVQVSKKKYDEDEDFEDSEEAESDISESDFEDPDMMEVSHIKKPLFKYCIHSRSRISDPGSSNSNKRGGKFLVFLPFCVATSHKHHKVVN